MPIFQKSVLQDYIEKLNKEKVDLAYKTFQKNYNSAKIRQIKTLKEEEYQDGFLRDIFVDVFGYRLRPDEKFDLQREFKNQTDGKKADAAIIKNENAKAVIELKSTSTKDLTKVTQQAFNYKNNQPECHYVITSNFQKLRFYIDYSNEFEEFDLFNLDRDRFNFLYLILEKNNLLSDLPIEIKRQTLFHEKKVSEDLYQDYSTFKAKLFKNLLKNHPKNDKLLLFKKSQKLLDRFLFILFAEDSRLLPTNSIGRIIERFVILKEHDAYKPLYEILQQYFSYMNNGRKGKTPSDDIPAYNGGLFYEDLLLNSLRIDDEVLIDDLKQLSKYDFNTEVDVNILGHIFEHSLNEIENITAEIEGEISDKKRTKRKKDGVYYTPKYITTYIVSNTIGKLCNEKRVELDLEEIEFDESIHNKDGRLSKKGKKLFRKLEKYKEWLFSLKIVDPACGSGAFLNQALNFLIEEHTKIDDIIAELTKTPLRLFDTDKNILEQNLFGVDINEESVEIAQLSLWLRTARKGRKLSKLNNNIKCGNSLLTSEFDWNKEFPEIMNEGGFDIVIGNPPYIKEATNKSAFNGLHDHICYQGKMDLWYFFGALALDIIKKDKGIIGFIAPNNWITNDGASKFRNYIIKNGRLKEFIDFGNFKVFDSAGIQTMIYIMEKTSNNEEYKLNFSKVVNSKINHEDAQLFLEKTPDKRFQYFRSSIEKNKVLEKPIHFINSEIQEIIDKIKTKENFHLESKEIASGIDLLQDFVNKKHKEVLNNVEIGDGIFNLHQNEYESLNLLQSEKALIKPFYTTNELKRYYGNPKNKYWIIYTDSSFKDVEKINDFPNIKNHLDKFKDVMTSVNKPYGLHRSRDQKYFEGEKIFSLRKCSNRPKFTYTGFDAYVNRTFMIIKTTRINLKFLTALLNSNLIAFWLKYMGKMQGDNYQIDKTPLINLPLIKPDAAIESKLSELISEILTNTKKEKEYNSLLIKSREANDFDREIQLSNQLEIISENIDKFENQINSIIYDLYNITPIEINTIEKNINSPI